MYLNMYRAGRLNNPGRTTTPTLEDLAGIIRRRARRRRERKNSLPVALSIDATGTMPRHLLLIIHHARSERQEPVARWPNTPRHEAAAGRRPAKERGGRRQKAGRPGAQRARGAGLATTRHQQSGTRPSSPPPQPSGPPAVSARVFRRLLLRISEKVRRFTDIFCIF